MNLSIVVGLKGYAEALGQLASDDAVAFTQEINALESSLKKIKIESKNPFEGSRAEAISSLARFLFNAALKGYRQKELRETIEIGHKYLGEIIEGLIDFAGDYQVILRNEKQNIKQLQIILILDRKQSPGKRLFSWLSDAEIDDKLFDTRRMIEFTEAKSRATEDYKTILRKIAEAHGKLYIASNQLNSDLLISEIRKYGGELIPLINNVREEFSK